MGATIDPTPGERMFDWHPSQRQRLSIVSLVSRMRLRVIELVADPAVVLDQSRYTFARLDLPTQPLHQTPQLAAPRRSLVPPQTILQRLVRYHAADVPHEVVKELVFEWGESHPFAADSDALVVKVDAQVARDKVREARGASRGADPAEHRFHPRQQLQIADGLDEVTVRPRVQRANEVGVIVVRSKNDYGKLGYGSNLSQHRPGGAVGKREVEDDDVRIVFEEAIQPRLTGGRRPHARVPPLKLESSCEALLCVGIGVNDQDLQRVGPRRVWTIRP